MYSEHSTVIAFLLFTATAAVLTLLDTTEGSTLNPAQSISSTATSCLSTLIRSSTHEVSTRNSFIGTTAISTSRSSTFKFSTLRSNIVTFPTYRVSTLRRSIGTSPTYRISTLRSTFGTTIISPPPPPSVPPLQLCDAFLGAY